jgi:peptide/nickel transport system substrate-binding protein
MTLRQRDLNRLMSHSNAAADVRTAITVMAKPAPHLLTALGSSESPITPRPFGEIFKSEEQPKLEQTIGTCPILKEWVPGNSVT